MKLKVTIKNPDSKKVIRREHIKVTNAETGELVNDIQDVTISHHIDSHHPIVVITLTNIDIECDYDISSEPPLRQSNINPSSTVDKSYQKEFVGEDKKQLYGQDAYFAGY